ncbi:hypothetical protein [Nocardioides sp. AX2bis]|uniref:hypothetical protein n=1 Tax=Nocardioides sp. AX2bis TaxID=2653157 RepID=UPI001359C57F|nr:hypothetical protein [Nocardioides sp. AX2bis]
MTSRAVRRGRNVGRARSSSTAAGSSGWAALRTGAAATGSGAGEGGGSGGGSDEAKEAMTAFLERRR